MGFGAKHKKYQHPRCTFFFETQNKTWMKKNPAYGTHQLSRAMQIVGPIQIWRGSVFYVNYYFFLIGWVILFFLGGGLSYLSSLSSEHLWDLDGLSHILNIKAFVSIRRHPPCFVCRRVKCSAVNYKAVIYGAAGLENTLLSKAVQFNVHKVITCLSVFPFEREKYSTKV